MIPRILGIILLLGTIGCSAIELNEQNQQATAQIEANVAGTVESRFATQSADTDTQLANVTATLERLFADATTEAETIDEQVSATLTAFVTEASETEVTIDPESTAEATPDAESSAIPTSVDIAIFGTVPIDSDSLNSITALAFDRDNNLLVSLRNGDIYRLVDEDNNDTADEVALVFEDTGDEIGQVSGIFTEGDLLYVVNSEQISQLSDSDADGIYDTVATLTDELPANQALLQANNSIIRSADGRYVTADVSTGDILLITLLND